MNYPDLKHTSCQKCPKIYLDLHIDSSQISKISPDPGWYILIGFRGSFPRPPCWGKNNDLEQWWNINDFKILCASYRHEVEGFLKTVSPYFSRGPKSDDDFPKPRTPTRVTGWSASVSELPAPQRVRYPDSDAKIVTYLLSPPSLDKEDSPLY